MFLAAAPYFSRRFQSNDWAANHYQSSILSVSTVTNLGSVFILAKLQKDASYPRRILVSLIINIVVFSLLAFSTIIVNAVSVGVYFVFLMLMVFGTSLATGINQNGVFAYVSIFGREEYTQAIMAGQGVAGVLPCIVQILSVLAVPEDGNGNDGQGNNNDDGPPKPPTESPISAFIYFMTATIILVLTLFAFLHLLKRTSHLMDGKLHDVSPEEQQLTFENHTHDDENGIDTTRVHKSIPLATLFRKLRWLALAVFTCFAVTMVFPVFTAKIQSVHASTKSRLFDSSVFIPLAFLLWNLGDLLGRVVVAVPSLSLSHRRPGLVFALSVSRFVFIPLYLLCNIRGMGAVVESDFFYLFIVQLLFGLTNGYIGSSCMMGAASWVDEDEREAAGGFMSLMLVAGLTVGSLGSFLVSGL